MKYLVFVLVVLERTYILTMQLAIFHKTIFFIFFLNKYIFHKTDHSHMTQIIVPILF